MQTSQQIQPSGKTIRGPHGLPILGVMPEMIRDMLGLFTKTAREFWLHERRLLQPAFHRERIAALASTASRVIDFFLQNWEPYARSNQHIDLDGEMIRLTPTLIIKSMFSSDIDDKIQSLSHAFNVASKFMLWRSEQMWAPPLSVQVPRMV